MVTTTLLIVRIKLVSSREDSIPERDRILINQ